MKQRASRWRLLDYEELANGDTQWRAEANGAFRFISADDVPRGAGVGDLVEVRITILQGVGRDLPS